MSVVSRDFLKFPTYGGFHKCGSSKSSNLMGFSLINQQFWGTPMTMETPKWKNNTCFNHQPEGKYRGKLIPQKPQPLLHPLLP